MKTILMICTFLFLLENEVILAQQTIQQNKELRAGNRDYKKGDYEKSENSYLKALNLNSTSYEGKFNLGDALYRQEKFDEAAKQFSDASKSTDIESVDMAKSFHNLGNSYFRDKKYKESIEAYKKSLKSDPDNNLTRENLAKAMMKLNQEQQQENQKNKEGDKQNEDQNKEKQKSENKDNKEQKDDKSNSGKSDEKSDKSERQESQDQRKGITKEDAERILNALKNQEKDLHKKLQAKPEVKSRTDKDW